MKAAMATVRVFLARFPTILAIYAASARPCPHPARGFILAAHVSAILGNR